MTEALLCLVLICAQGAMDAQFEWAHLSSEYALPPAVIVEGEIGDGARGLHRGFDDVGRALITVAPGLRGTALRKTVAHEAYHVAARLRGEPYGDLAEERAANTFAYCWIRDATYVPERPCAEALRSIPSRW